MSLTSKDTTFGTPKNYFDYYNHWYGPFKLDAAAKRDNHLCPRWLGPGGLHEDALDPAVKWHRLAKNVWLNPPYSRGLGDWVRRAWEEHRSGCRVVMLLPASTGPAWFRDYCHGQEIHWLGRIKFVGGASGARQDAMAVILTPPADFRITRA